MKTQIHGILGIDQKHANDQQLDSLIEHAVNIALNVYEAQYGFVALLNDDGSFHFRSRKNTHHEPSTGSEHQISNSIFEKAIRNKQSLIISDDFFEPDFHDPSKVKFHSIRSIIVAPLIEGDSAFGAICVQKHDNKPTPKNNDLAPLERLAALVTASIADVLLCHELDERWKKCANELGGMMELLETKVSQHKHLDEQLQWLTATDPLTELWNRGYFFSQAEAIFQESISNGAELSALVVDVDQLKKINEKFGHRIGDQTLQVVAAELGHGIRTHDILGRYDGDEFIILMPSASADKAAQVAYRLLQRIESRRVDSEVGPIPTSVSIGVADCSRGVKGIDELIDFADQALMSSKAKGGNQVSKYWDRTPVAH